jgi:hypothetical protein
MTQTTPNESIEKKALVTSGAQAVDLSTLGPDEKRGDYSVEVQSC